MVWVSDSVKRCSKSSRERGALGSKVRSMEGCNRSIFSHLGDSQSGAKAEQKRSKLRGTCGTCSTVQFQQALNDWGVGVLPGKGRAQHAGNNSHIMPEAERPLNVSCPMLLPKGDNQTIEINDE